MKYFPIFNQTKALDWGLNVSEALVFDYLYELPSWANSIVLYGNMYYFAAREKVCEELPIVTQKPDTMYRIFKSLQDKGLIEIYKLNKVDFVRLLEPAKRWREHGKFSDNSEKNPSKLGKFSDDNSENFPTYNNSTNDNQYTNYHNNIENEKLNFQSDFSSNGQKQKKAPQTGGRRAKKEKIEAPEILFSESNIFEFEAFEEYMKESYPEADPNFYYIQVKNWQNADGTKPKRKNWKKVVGTFISNDIRSEKLKTSTEYASQQRESRQQASSDSFKKLASLMFD